MYVKKTGKWLWPFITVLMIVGFFGCAGSTGQFGTCAQTQTQLNQSNYKIIKTGVTGSADCWYILSVIPLGDVELYKRAMNDLRKNAHPSDRPISFINVTKDASYQSYLFVNKVKLTLTADVIEFK